MFYLTTNILFLLLNSNLICQLTVYSYNSRCFLVEVLLYLDSRTAFTSLSFHLQVLRQRDFQSNSSASSSEVEYPSSLKVFESVFPPKYSTIMNLHISDWPVCLRNAEDIRTKYIDYQLYILTINSTIIWQLTVFFLIINSVFIRQLTFFFYSWTVIWFAN